MENQFILNRIGPSSAIFDGQSPDDFKKTVSDSFFEQISYKNIDKNNRDIVLTPGNVKSLGKSKHGSKMSLMSFSEKTNISKLSQFISKLYIVINFIMKLKETAAIRKPKFLSTFHFSIINDKCFYPDAYYKGLTDNEKNKAKRRASIIDILEGNQLLKLKKIDKKHFIRLFSFLKKKVVAVFYRFPIIDPNYRSTMIINIFQVILISFYFFFIPLDITFDIDVLHEFKTKNYYLYILFMELFPFLIFIFFSFFDLHKAFYKKGALVKDRKLVINRYVKKYLIYDIVSVSFLFISVLTGGIDENIKIFKIFTKFLSLIFFLKFIKFKALINEIEEYLYLDDSTYNLYSLINLLYKTLFLLHIIACIWYIIGSFNQNGSNSWIIKKGISFENWGEIYIYSFYYIIITINTVGYGDITPTNINETIFTIILVFLGCGFFAYIIASIGNIIKQISKRNIEFKRQVNIINGYMRKKNISFNLRKSIRKYFEHIWTEEFSENHKDEEIIINSLSTALKEKLLLEANGNLLKKAKYLCENFSEEVLKKCVFSMKELRFIPGEIIYNDCDNNDKSIYLLRKGEVGIFLGSNKPHQSKNIVFKISKGQSFGEEEFFNMDSRKLGAISTDYTTVLRICQQDFIKILESFPEDKEKYNLIKNQAKEYDDFSDINIKCKSCLKSNHSFCNCPWINKKFYKNILIKKHLYSVDTYRKKMTRKLIKKFTMKNSRIIKSEALLIKNSYINNTETFTLEFYSESDDDFDSNEISINNKIDSDNEILSDNSGVVEENKNDDLNISNFPHEHIRNFPRIRSLESLNLNEQNRIDNLSDGGRNIAESLERSNSRISNRSFNESIVIFHRQKSKTSDNKKENTNTTSKELKNKKETKKLEFDKISNFKIYQPEFNIENVLEKFKIQISILKRMKKRSKKFYTINMFKIHTRELFKEQSKKFIRKRTNNENNFFTEKTREHSGIFLRIQRRIPSKIEFLIRTVLFRIKSLLKSFVNAFSFHRIRKMNN